MRYFIGFLVTIGLIVLIIFLLLGHHGSKPNAATSGSNVLSLIDYADTSTSKLFIDGPVVDDAHHKSLEIDVSKDTVNLTVYNGYPKEAVRTQTYPNNSTAYGVFLQSLQHAKFTFHDPTIGYDERGYCPTGNRYILSYENNGADLRRNWTTSCGQQGSFKGDLSTILWLFKNQVTDYTSLTQDTALY